MADTVLFFDASNLQDLKKDLLQDSGVHRDRGKFLCCAHCRHHIAPASSAMEINGRHTHHRRNPHGHHFVFQCYRAAPGCAVNGEPTTDFSWFSGYRWQFASCDQCQLHLGWYFSGDRGFFGLIRDNIILCDEGNDEMGH
jgi:hypothetical protein